LTVLCALIVVLCVLNFLCIHNDIRCVNNYFRCQTFVIDVANIHIITITLQTNLYVLQHISLKYAVHLVGVKPIRT
jgi:hypothetical protein